MSAPMKALRTLACLFALALCFSSCNPQPEKSPGSRLMKLTSDYTEIVVSSSRVPGYWARPISDGEKIFLYTLDHSYKTGEALRVEGALGPATAAVFDDETGVYEYLPMVNVFIIWKAALANSGKGAHLPAKEMPGK
jgi:hypothetical protein